MTSDETPEDVLTEQIAAEEEADEPVIDLTTPVEDAIEQSQTVPAPDEEHDEV